jgi:hypothetical protein
MLYVLLAALALSANGERSVLRIDAIEVEVTSARILGGSTRAAVLLVVAVKAHESDTGQVAQAPDVGAVLKAPTKTSERQTFLLRARIAVACREYFRGAFDHEIANLDRVHECRRRRWTVAIRRELITNDRDARARCRIHDLVGVLSLDFRRAIGTVVFLPYFKEAAHVHRESASVTAPAATHFRDRHWTSRREREVQIELVEATGTRLRWIRLVPLELVSEVDATDCVRRVAFTHRARLRLTATA